jgi:hypothetical protein
MTHVTKIKISLEVSMHHSAPDEVKSDEEVKEGVKQGLEDMLGWGSLPEDIKLDAYFCEVSTSEKEPGNGEVSTLNGGVDQCV